MASTEHVADKQDCGRASKYQEHSVEQQSRLSTLSSVQQQQWGSSLQSKELLHRLEKRQTMEVGLS